MTISANLLERVQTSTTTESLFSPDVLATVINVDTPHDWAGGLVADQPLLVTRVSGMQQGTEPPDYAMPWVGTVRMVRGANITHRGWVVPRPDHDPDGVSIRVFGAPVNPEMVADHYYMIIGAEFGPAAYLGAVMQYRPGASIQYALVRHGDGRPLVNPDGWHDFSSFAYVEVQMPEDAAPRAEDAAPSSIEELVESDDFGLLDDEEPVGIPTDIPRSDVPVHGRNYIPEDERVPFKPEPVLGNYYVVWWPENTTYPRVAVYEEAGFIQVGRAGRWGYEADYAVTPLDMENAHWTHLIETPTTPSTDSSDAEVTRLNSETDRVVNEFEDMKDALDQMARDKGWCDEYEEVMKRGGMEGRAERIRPPEPERHAYQIEVRATFEWSGNPSSGSIDSAVAEWAEVDEVDVTDITLTGHKTFTLETLVAENEDVARNSITNSSVENELDIALCEFDCDRLVRFEIVSVTEDEEYDFDD